MAERDARTVAAALFALLATIPAAPVDSVDLRRGRPVMCGDCGVSTSIYDACNWCGGYAEPIVKTQLKGEPMVRKMIQPAGRPKPAPAPAPKKPKK